MDSRGRERPADIKPHLLCFTELVSGLLRDSLKIPVDTGQLLSHSRARRTASFSLTSLQ